MSIISSSFKKNAGVKFAKSLGVEDEQSINLIVEAWTKGFDVAESMFVEQ